MADTPEPDRQGDPRMPDLIPDTPENVMRAILSTPPDRLEHGERRKTGDAE